MQRVDIVRNRQVLQGRSASYRVVRAPEEARHQEMTPSTVIAAALVLAAVARSQEYDYTGVYGTDVLFVHCDDSGVTVEHCSCDHYHFGDDSCAYWQGVADAGRCTCGEAGALDGGGYVLACCGAGGAEGSALVMRTLNDSRVHDLHLSGCPSPDDLYDFVTVYGLEIVSTDSYYFDLRNELTDLTGNYSGRHVTFLRGSAFDAGSLKSASFVACNRTTALSDQMWEALRDGGDYFVASTGDEFLATLIYSDTDTA